MNLGMVWRLIAVAMWALAAPVAADTVTDWSDLSDAVVKAGDSPDSFNPATAQASSRVVLAMFEAANAADRRYASWLKVAPAAPGASGPIAVATAAHDMLLALYPAQKAMVDNAYMLDLAKVADGKAKSDGIAAGHAAAVAALAAGGVDPAAKPEAPYWPKPTPGVWQSTAPTVFTPEGATLKAWFLTSRSQFRPGPPVALGSARWVDDVEEVRRLGARDSTERSAVDTLRARFWAPYEINSTIRAVASQPGRSLVRNARFYALVSMTLDDMEHVLGDGKLHYGFWRPISAIRSGGGNPAIKADPNWEPLLKTPLHPEYPCGHCVEAAGLAAIFEAEGVPAGGLPFTNDKFPGMVVTVATPAEYARQVSFSRICAGVHFRSTTEVSDKIGRDLALYAMGKFAPPIGK